MLLRERIAKKIVEFSTKVVGWGQQRTDFLLISFFFFKFELKSPDVALGSFKDTLFFFNFWVGDPSQLGSWSEGCVKPLKLSRESI